MIQQSAEFNFVCSCQSTFTLSLVFHRSIFQYGSFLKWHLCMNSPAECLTGTAEVFRNTWALGCGSLSSHLCSDLHGWFSRPGSGSYPNVHQAAHVEKQFLWLVAHRSLCCFQTTGSHMISTRLLLKHGLILPVCFILSSENTKEQHLGSHYDGGNVVLLQAVYCCSGTVNVACRRKSCTNGNQFVPCVLSLLLCFNWAFLSLIE